MRFFTVGDQKPSGYTHHGLPWQQRDLSQADPSPRFWQQCPAIEGSFRHGLYLTYFVSQLLTQISPLGGILQCSLTLASWCSVFDKMLLAGSSALPTSILRNFSDSEGWQGPCWELWTPTVRSWVPHALCRAASLVHTTDVPAVFLLWGIYSSPSLAQQPFWMSLYML